MPNDRNIIVTTCDHLNQPILEYGRYEEGFHKTFSYVQSVKGQALRIYLRPEGFPIPELFVNDHTSITRPLHVPFQTHSRPRPAPMQIMATLRLDGRPEYEQRVILWMDKSQARFNHRGNGVVIMSSRATADQNNDLRLRQWCFDHRIGGIVHHSNMEQEGAARETVLVNSDLSRRDQDRFVYDHFVAPPLHDRDAPVAQIEITLDRIILGRITEGVELQLKSGGVSKTVKFDTIHFDYHDRERDGPYAKFTFFYKTAADMRKDGIPGFPQTPCEDTDWA